MSSPSQAAQAVSACGFIVEPSDLWARRINRRHLSAAPRIEAGRFHLPGQAALRISADQLSWSGDELASPDAWVRAAAMETAGVQAEILYPTFSWSLYGLEDKGLQTACFEAYNSWLYSFMLAGPLRFQGVALVAASDAGLLEFERCAAMKYKSAVVPAELDTPFAERLWATAAALGLPVTLGFPEVDPARHPTAYAEQSWTFVLRMARAGLFQRHPGLQVVVIGGAPPIDIAAVGGQVSWVDTTAAGPTGGVRFRLWARRPGSTPGEAAAARDAAIQLYALPLTTEIADEDVFATRRQFSATGRVATSKFGKAEGPGTQSPVLELN